MLNFQFCVRTFLQALSVGVACLTASVTMAQTSGAPFTWVPSTAKALQVSSSTAVYNGYLWQGALSDDSPNVITAFNGSKTLPGGKAVGSYIATFHPTGSGLYLSAVAPRVQGVATSITGTFTQGETVTQASTGAVGSIVSLTGNAFILAVQQGNFNNTPFVGSTSGASITPTNIATDVSFFLERSTDGFADFVPVMNIPYKLKMRGLVDCGLVKFKTRTTRVLLAFDDPTEPGQYGSAYYNLPDIDNNWNVLLRTQLDTGDRSIRHFHGAVWVPGAKKLIVMTGDSEEESSLLVCDDIADLVTYPQKWRKRWGLDRAGSDRVNFLNRQGHKYCIGSGSQECRVIDIIPDENSQYAYYIPDTGYITYLMRIDLTNNTLVNVGPTRAKGYGWMGLRTSSGNILFGAASEVRDSIFQGNSDPYSHLYALTPDRTDIVEIWKTPRVDGNLLTDIRGHYISQVEYKGFIYIAGSYLTENNLVGTVVPSSQANAAGLKEQSSYTDMLTQFTSQDMLSGVGYFNSSNLVNWSAFNCDLSIDTTNTFTDSSGTYSSMLCQPQAGTTGLVSFQKSATPGALEKAQNTWITLVGYVRTETPQQKVGVRIRLSDGRQVTKYFVSSGGWDRLSATTFVRTNTTSIVMQLIARAAGNSTTKVWFSKFICKAGAVPRL